MASHLSALFEDKTIVTKIQKRLPYLFQLAELESSRAGKVGMEVGSVREKIIVALLIYKFGKANVETEFPIIQPEVDAKLFGQPISIKTITGKSFTGVKLIWAVDAQKAREFAENYSPSCDILLVQINWDEIGRFYYIPLQEQSNIFKTLGRVNYIKLPKSGTNPRGVEITKEALTKIVNSSETKSIIINWQKSKIEFNPFKRWVDLWEEE